MMAEQQHGREMPQYDIMSSVALLKTLPGEYQGRPLQQTTKDQARWQ